MKRTILLLAILLASSNVFAQSSKQVSAWNNLTAYKEEGKVADLVEAMEAIELATVHEKTINNPKTWYYRGLVYAELAKNVGEEGVPANSMDEALMSFEKVYDLDVKKKYSKDATNSMLLMSGDVYNVGATAFEGQDYGTAYKYFMKMLDINEFNNRNSKSKTIDTASMFAASLSAVGAGMTTEAKDMFHQLLDIEYKDPNIYTNLINIYLQEENAEKANEIMAAGRSAFPDNSELAFAEINYLLKEDRHDEAESRMVKAVELEPENANLRYALGTVYDKLGNVPKATAAYEKAIELNPEFHDAYYNLGAVFYNQAVEKVTEMNGLDLNDQTNYDRLKGESDGMFNKALPLLEKALDFKAGDRNSLIALSEIYARLNMFDKLKAVKAQLGE